MTSRTSDFRLALRGRGDPRAVLARLDAARQAPRRPSKPPDVTARRIDPVPLGPGKLADDVARYIWTERGRFSPTLYDPRV